jgi:hypothetical protein
MTRAGLNPGRRGGKPATNRLSYGAAKFRTHTEPPAKNYKFIYLFIYFCLYRFKERRI